MTELDFLSADRLIAELRAKVAREHVASSLSDSIGIISPYETMLRLRRRGF
ncbi:hypothetical protein [Bradyrhizobium viridifuturi]|uniref:hypothetical protein n=1 Tax=Bradyrhizobium viridifuturi TaxID=1654716 RepID=UPI001AEC0E20|nr:hypothetical protein [Bradyrhizobium viridifuturi]